jgi:nucleoside transporter
MMFLEFFIWGAWYVTTNPFMKQMAATTKNNAWLDAIAWAYTVCPIAAIISPFFLGIIADRFFASERVLGVMQIIGGIALLVAPRCAAVSPTAFIFALLIHALCYMPTLGLTNTIAFHHISNQEKEFPLIRVFGTIGWIVGGAIFVSLVFKADATATQYYVAGAGALALGVYSFFLPHTPAPAKGKKASVREILGVDALSLMKDPSFLIFVICSFLICIPLATYYAFTNGFVEDVGIQRVGAVMNVGQAAEIIFMIIMPLFFLRLGVKWMLALGMFAWALRYTLFALAAPTSILWMIVLGIALHGVCYDFFFVTGFIYTDKRASREIRGQAQGLLVLVTQGLGLGIGAQLSGWLFGEVIGKASGTAALPLYQKFWALPAAFAFVVMLVFIAFFRNGVTSAPSQTLEAEGTPTIADI